MKTKLRRLMRKVSLFALACSLVAIGYLGYRAYLVMGPKGLQGIMGSEGVAAAVTIGCEHDDKPQNDSSAQTFPIITDSYQGMIRSASHLSKNLAQNSSLEASDIEKKNPANFYRIVENETNDYAYLRDPSDNMPFLRSVNTQTVDDDKIAGGWIMDPVTIQTNATYAYGFEYRSTASVRVSLEYTLPNGDIEYQNVTQLNRSNTWERFTAHIHNFKGAKAFRFVVVSREAGRLDTRSYDVHRITSETLKNGVVSITFDDGWQSIKDKAIPILDDYKYPSTQYVISEAAEKNVPGYMSMEAIKDIRRTGHEIGSHTIKHCDLTQMPNEEVERNAKDSKESLENAGLGPVRSLAYPYGRYNENVETIIGSQFPLMRSSDAGYNDRYFDDRNIRSMVVRDKTTDKEFQSWINYAEENKLWLVIVYHRIDEHGEYSITSQQLTRQLDMIKSSKLRVMTLGGAADLVRR